jgi:prepilin-type N-terminal cleavage/methylation domain-containing protein
LNGAATKSLAAPLLNCLSTMFQMSRLDRGFSVLELMMVVAVAGTLAVVAIPVMTDLAENSKLSAATREVERELQSARLKSVSTNRLLRVRFNCPSEGYFRTVEVLGTSDDSSSARCQLSGYPYPAPDTNLMTQPNYDGPLRILPHDATVTSATFEFRPDGTVYQVVAVSPEVISSAVTVTVTRREKTKAMTVNGAGRIQLQ